MANLFDISLEYMAILDELEENGGELTDDIQERLNINKDEVQDKLESYRKVIMSVEGEIVVLEEERDRLTDKVITKSNVIARLKENISKAITLYGDVNPKSKVGSKFIATPYSKFTFVHTNPVVIDENLLITPDNEKLLPYINGTFTVKVKGEDILNIRKQITAIEGIEANESYSIMKKEIKPLLENNEFGNDIYIDKAAGYVKIS